MSDGSDNGLAIGPVDLVVIGYPPDAPQTGSAVPIFIDLVERGIIRVLDVKGLRRDADGSYSGFDIGDADANGVPDMVAFHGAQTGLIRDDDVRVAVEAMEPGTAAIMIVFENRWAAPFVNEVRRNGGRLIAYERVGAQDLLDAIEALEEAEPAIPTGEGV